MMSRCFPTIACSLLSILFIYGIIGIVSNAQELTTTEGHGGWPYNQNPAHGALIVIQSCYFATLTLGILGFWREERTFYYWAAAILLGVFVSLFVFGIVCLRSSLKDMTPDIFNTLKKSKSDPKEFDWFFMLQYEHKCCGVSSFNDWSVLKTGLDNTSVPQTCCSRDQTVLRNLDCGLNILSPSIPFEEIKKMIYIEPCGPKLSQIIQSKTMYLGMEMMIASFATIATATFLYCGATELFCLGNNGDDSQAGIPKSSGSALSVAAEYGQDSEVDSEYSKSTVGASSTRRGSIGSKGKIRFSTAVSKNSNFAGNPNSQLQRNETGATINGAKKTNAATKSGTSAMQRARALSNSMKGNKQQLLPNKLAIDRNSKASKLAKNPRKWKGTSQIASKALIFGSIRMDSKANFTNANVTVQNLEMLFEGIDKNFSTLSTTPNPSGLTSFPAMHNKTGTPSGVGTSTKTPPKDKPVFPNISHYSSLPLFHLVKFPTGELGTLGQFNLAPNRNQKQVHRHTYFNTVQPSIFGAPISTNINNNNNANNTLPPLSSPSTSHEYTESPDSNIGENSSKSDLSVLTTSMNPDNCDDTLYTSQMSTTVRSVTLATIQEESESLRGSPTKIISTLPSSTEIGPIQDLTNVNTFGGSYINEMTTLEGLDNSVADPKLESNENLAIRNESDQISEKIVPLGPVATGEFTVTATLPLVVCGKISEETVSFGPVATGEFTLTSAVADEISDQRFEKAVPLGPVATEEFIVTPIRPKETVDLGQFTNSPLSCAEDITITLEEDAVVVIDSTNTDGTIATGSDKDLKSDEFEGTLAIEDTIAEIGALAKARASKAQFRLGFDGE